MANIMMFVYKIRRHRAALGPLGWHILLLSIISFLYIADLTFAQTTHVCGTDSVNDSCQQGDFQTSHTAASDGDTIRIANGTHDWSSGSWPNGFTITKRITVTGSGSCTDCGDDKTATGSWPTTLDVSTSQNQVFIIASTSGTGRVQINGIKFQGQNKHNYDWFSDNGPGAFIVVGRLNEAEVIIDNNEFHSENTGNSYDSHAIATQDYPAYHLIHSNYFHNDGNDGHFITITRGQNDTSLGRDQYGATAWANDAVDFGSANFVFVEDNTFAMGCVLEPPGSIFGPVSIDAFNGGKYVARYNYTYQAFFGGHDLSGGNLSRAVHMAEIYNNRIRWERGGGCGFTDNSAFAGATLVRGGSYFIHNNNFGSAEWQYGTRLMYTRPGWPACDNANVYDGPASSPDGYPCLDQPGWVTASGTNEATYQPQVNEPVRVYNNTGTFAGGCPWASFHSNAVCHAMGSYAIEDTEWIWSADATAAKPGYTTYTYPHPLRGEITDTDELEGVTLTGVSFQ